MLTSILSRQTCAACRFCCAFRRVSLWETPLFPPESVRRLTDQGYHFAVDGQGAMCHGRMMLDHKYQTDDPEEEAPCDYLDPAKGCTLTEDKPLDCSIWPLRVMRRTDGSLVIALTPTCPAVNKVPLAQVKDLVQSGLGQKIRQAAVDMPFMIKPYKEGFPILMEL